MSGVVIPSCHFAEVLCTESFSEGHVSQFLGTRLLNSLVLLFLN